MCFFSFPLIHGFYIEYACGIYHVDDINDPPSNNSANLMYCLIDMLRLSQLLTCIICCSTCTLLFYIFVYLCCK